VIFRKTPLPGVFVVELETIEDERGSFARTFSVEDFAAHGLDPAVVQCSVSFNLRTGTLRGMHYQEAPHAESKLVRCTRGAIFDVAVDLRRESPAYCRWFGIELTPDNGRMLYIPEGLAHGFQTLAEASEVHYQISHEYVPAAGAGVRWDDPVFGIDWPAVPQSLTISERDRTYPDFIP
jgi:dTDP-4-dehydrorhamnose 3,5-epimerase